MSTTVSTAAIVTCTSLATAGASIIAISVAYSVTTASAIVVDRCGSAWLLLVLLFSLSLLVFQCHRC